MLCGKTIAAIIPALNEEAGLGRVLRAIPPWVDRIVVADNGSTDATPIVAAHWGATVVREPRRGYGAACLRGLSAIGRPDIVVFLDADGSDDPSEMSALVNPILQGNADLVIGSRALGECEVGALTPVQRFGNWLSSLLIRRLWGQSCTDLGPFRAIRYSTLLALQLSDLDYGWTVQMQARACRHRARMVEVPVTYRRRVGQSKISGTLRGVLGAGSKILITIAREYLSTTLRVQPEKRLIVFTRFPEAGRSKTRLIPALGPKGAADLQREMTKHTLSVARRWARRAGAILSVYYSGGSMDAMRDEFGDEFNFVPQTGGALGMRLFQAFRDAEGEGAAPIVVIGCDCPEISAEVLGEAFERLRASDAVVGPAADGGYYLLGLNRAAPELFHDIAWGTPHVLSQTLSVLARLQMSTAQLAPLHDIDLPDDLPHWERAKNSRIPDEVRAPRLSVVLATLNESRMLPETLASIGRRPEVEVIVVDGGSSDHTRMIAENAGARLLQTVPCRGKQLNIGAAAARGEIVLFLHGDTRVPFGYWEQIESCLNDAGTIAGAFRFALDDSRLTLRPVEFGTRWRCRWFRLPFGDQGLFMRRGTFHLIGGFRELATMEDYDIVVRLRAFGRIHVLPTAAITSARRWLSHGVGVTSARHLIMILGWKLGWSPEQLQRLRPASARDFRTFKTGIPTVKEKT